MSNNKLLAIVENSGLSEEKRAMIQESFREFSEIAAKWEEAAKTITVTDPSQTEMMAKAGHGRRILKERRIAVEHLRKSMKESALREGQTIDKIARYCRELITPIEEYLEKQEKFVEIRVAEEEARVLGEHREKVERERLAQEEADREAARLEREKIAAENKRLKAEASAREKEHQAELEREREAREKTEKEAAAEKQKAEKVQEKLDKAKEKTTALKAEVKEYKSRPVGEVECPNCKHRFVPKEKEGD